MGTLLAYLIKSAACLILFYIFYKLLLAKETFHCFNRFALLGVLLFSAVLPFIQINAPKLIFVQARIMLDEIKATPLQGESDYLFQWQWLLIIIYTLGWLFFLIKIIISYTQIIQAVHRNKSTAIDDHSNIRLILIDKKVSPFSWMNYIVISREDYKESGEIILTHEMAHIDKHHSIDMILCDIFILFQWFNPASWLLKKEIQNIHEYEADEKVLHCGIDAKNYQLLLIKKAVGPQLFSMANSLNHSSIKKRITMMLKQKSNAWARLKYVYVLPLAAISVAAFAHKEVSKPLEKLSEVKVSDLSSYVEQKVDKSTHLSSIVIKNNNLQQPKKKKVVTTTTTDLDNSVYEMVEDMPKYPGGQGKLILFLQNNIKYPESCAKNNIQGRAIVQFIVDKTGLVRDAKIMRHVNPELDAEALRIVNAMPRWIPGKENGKAVSVKYTLPISFALQCNKKTSRDSISSQHSKTIDVAVIIDGVVYKDFKKYYSIPKEQIKKAYVMSAEDSKKLYNVESAIIIETKK